MVSICLSGGWSRWPACRWQSLSQRWSPPSSLAWVPAKTYAQQLALYWTNISRLIWSVLQWSSNRGLTFIVALLRQNRLSKTDNNQRVCLWWSIIMFSSIHILIWIVVHMIWPVCKNLLVPKYLRVKPKLKCLLKRNCNRSRSYDHRTTSVVILTFPTPSWSLKVLPASPYIISAKCTVC